MNQSDIRARYEAASSACQKARLDFELAVGGHQGVIASLQRICEHPNKFQTSCMGDLGWKCDDCGWSV